MTNVRQELLVVEAAGGRDLELRRALEPHWHIDTARSCVQAMGMLEMFRFDAVLISLTIDSPQDGLNLIERVQADQGTYDGRVIFTSDVEPSLETRLRMIRLASPFLPQPLDPNRLVEVLRQCGRPQAWLQAAAA